MTIEKIRLRRITAGIAGQVLCQKLGCSRSHLTNLERGYRTATPEDLRRIDEALGELILAKAKVVKAAEVAGWPMSEVA